MNSTLVRSISAVLLVLAVAACSGSAHVTPAPTAPSTDVNPITGSRGGSGAR